MASAFGHAAVAWGIGTGFIDRDDRWKIWGLGIFSSIMPDFDTIGFKFGIAYGSIWGHRGFTHGLPFAIFWAIVLYLIFFKKSRKLNPTGSLLILAYLFIATISHGLLDAITTGGKGVGFFTPFMDNRYFFPLRIIKVSPMSISRFFSEWGWKVIKNEFFYLMLPALIFGISQIFIKRRLFPKKS